MFSPVDLDSWSLPLSTHPSLSGNLPGPLGPSPLQVFSGLSSSSEFLALGHTLPGDWSLDHSLMTSPNLDGELAPGGLISSVTEAYSPPRGTG